MSILKIDSQKVQTKLIRFIRRQMQQANFEKVVVGLSGGLDSSLVVHLCCLALGSENVFALILPYKTNTSESINCAKLLARKYQVRTRFIEITPQIDAYFKHFPKADKVRRGNKMARERMTILYDQAKDLGALVAGTSNRTECLLGYGTLFGDCAYSFGVLQIVSQYQYSESDPQACQYLIQENLVQIQIFHFFQIQISILCKYHKVVILILILFILFYLYYFYI